MRVQELYGFFMSDLRNGYRSLIFIFHNIIYAGRQSKVFCLIFCTGLASDVSSDPLNDGILELNFLPCRLFVPPILSRCF